MGPGCCRCGRRCEAPGRGARVARPGGVVPGRLSRSSEAVDWGHCASGSAVFAASCGFGGSLRGNDGVRAVLAFIADLAAGRAARSAPAAALHALKFLVRGGVEEGS